jgi:predicted DNA-binding transcriptional regulator AlpA
VTVTAAELLTQDELAAELRIAGKTLENWRYLGRGPKYAKIGSRIRYRRADVDRWLKSRTRGGMP